MSDTLAIDSYKAAIRKGGKRSPFYYVADLLGVGCADRTDAVIAEEMVEQLGHAWMELPRDADAQPVHWDDAVYVNVCGDEVFAKVFGVCDHNRVALYVPGEDVEHRYQSVNAHTVRAVDDEEAEYEKAIGNNIRARLSEAHMTQRELARRARVTEAAISRYVMGEREPRARTLARIAHALGCTCDELLEGAM